jgi:hypothetical protein
MKNEDEPITESLLKQSGFYQDEDDAGDEIWCINDNKDALALTMSRYDDETWGAVIGEDGSDGWPYDMFVMGQVWRLMHAMYLQITDDPIYVLR